MILKGVGVGEGYAKEFYLLCLLSPIDDDVTKVCDDTQLLDNGGGDADITADDGVYSR